MVVLGVVVAVVEVEVVVVVCNFTWLTSRYNDRYVFMMVAMLFEMRVWVWDYGGG